jgi:FKBP-type peptidyl-prolyl cis-trans isomerase SlyD
MKVQSGCIIEVKYILRKDNEKGEILEIMDEHWPFKFLFGSGILLPTFEQNLEALEDGMHFKFSLSAEEAYGKHDVSKIVQVFKEDIEEDHRYPIDNYEAGDFVNLSLGSAQQVSGVIHKIAKDYILVDGNHAMAGIDLHFEGQILNVRQAREDELLNSRYIEPNGIRSHSRLSEPPNQ